MKRLIWFLLAAFCTALAQVQPVDLPVTKHEVCGCCEGTGSCGMPDCVPQPATNQPVPVVMAPLVQRAAVRRQSPGSRQKPECFYAQFVSRPALTPAFRVPSVAAASVRVPFFKAHCSFLI